MAESVEKLLIRIDATTEQLRRELKRAETAVSKTDRMIAKATGSMRKGWGAADKALQRHTTSLTRTGAIAAGGLALAVKAVASYSDSYKQLQGQLALVTKSEEEKNRIYQRALDISNDTGATLESTVNLYARMTRATQELSLSEQERLQITNAINQSMIVSGATSQEAEAAIIQLSQGLASGALRGQELNSVMEQSPRLARAIADGAGIAYGELREMAAQGEITSELVTTSILRMSGEIQGEFDKMPMTVDRAMNRVQNVLKDSFGKADLSPLLDSISELEKLLSDPAIAQGLTQLAADIAKVGGAAIEAMAHLPGFVRWVSDLGNDFKSKNLVETSDSIFKIEQQLARLDMRRAPHQKRAAELRKELARLNKVYDEQVKALNDASRARGNGAKSSEDEAEAVDEVATSYARLEPIEVEASYRKSKYVDKTNMVLAALAFQEDQLDRTAREQFIYNEIQKAGVTVTAENAEKIREAAGALFDQKESIEAATGAANVFDEALTGMAERIDSEFSSAWKDAFSGSLKSFGDFAERMKDAMLEMLAEMAHLAITRPIMVAFTGAMGFGSGSAAAAPGSAGVTPSSMAGGFSSMFSGFSGGMTSLYGGASDMLRSAGFDSLANNAAGQAGIYGQGGLTSVGYGALNAGAGFAGNYAATALGFDRETTGLGSTIGGTIGSIYGPIGTAIGSFAGQALESTFFGQDNNGNNRGSADFDLGARTSQRNEWGTDGGGGNADTAFALVEPLQRFADAIGGSSFAGNITVGNNNGIMFGGQSYGQNAEAFIGDAFRAIIEGAEGLDQSLKNLLLSFDGSSEEMAAYSVAMLSLNDAISSNPVEDATSDLALMIEAANTTMSEAYAQQGEELSKLMTEYDGSAEATVELAEAMTTSRGMAYQLSIAILEMSEAIGTILGDQAQYFREAVMSEEQLQQARIRQRDELFAQLKAANDPEEVLDLVNQLATVNRQIFDNLTEDQQKAQVTQFTAFTEEIDSIAQEILGTALSDLKLSQDEINKQLAATISSASGELIEAASSINQSVGDFGRWVSNLVNSGITINVQGGEVTG